MAYKFQVFDPFNSFQSDHKRFVNKLGEEPNSLRARTQDSDDALNLWYLGRDAFREIGSFQERSLFEEAFNDHATDIEILVDALNQHAHRFNFLSPDGKKWEPEFSDERSASILDVFWQLGIASGDLDVPVAKSFLFACLEEIDRALIGLALAGEHVHAVMAAVQAYGNYQAIVTGNKALQKMRSEQASRAAIERHARDPKQVEKLFVYECWKAWQEKPDLYAGPTAFARDMLTKCIELTSQKKIEDWCRAWKKAFTG